VSDRIEEIRERLENAPDEWDNLDQAKFDVSYLLQRLEELEYEVAVREHAINRIRENNQLLRDENQRLQSQLERRDLQIAEIRQGAEF
jgi:predicted  nucleic acid-binding Zn-ribbon protein